MMLDIEELSDQDAERVLHQYVRGATATAPTPVDALPALSRAEVNALLADVAQAHTTPARVPSDAELAREALRLLAQSPATASRLAQLRSAAALQVFTDPATLIVTSAVAFSVLQLAGFVSYDRESGWKLRVEKKAASDSVLLSFIAKVLAKFGGPS